MQKISTIPGGNKGMKKFILPLIIGIFLGLISVLMGQIPKAVAIWSGMMVLGNHVGYLLAALIIAYVYSQKWFISFITSSLTIIIASTIYYLLIFIIQELSPAIVYHEFEFDGLFKWSVIGIIIGGLSATTIHFVVFAKTKLIRYGTLIAIYLAMLWFVVYNFVLVLNLYKNNNLNESFTSIIFEFVFAVILITIYFTVILFKIKSTYKDQKNTTILS